ncbi:MAG: peptidase M23 [Marinovum sp.]|nr:peptidase M23 [Marinovum sp.]
MRSKLVTKLHDVSARYFPERRVFFNTQKGMRYLHVKAKTQMLVCLGAATFVIWTAISTAILCIDLLGADNFRQQAKRDADFYHQELSNLKSDRDAKTAQANNALHTFTRAIDYADQLQSQLLEMELQQQEMQSALRILQEKLAAAPLAMPPTNAETEHTAIEDKTAADLTPAPGLQSEAAVERLVAILEETTAERDQVLAQSHKIISQTDELKLELQLTEEKNQRIFRQLEDALTISVQPLDKMFRTVGLNTETLLEYVRQGYSGLGGQFMPLTLSTRGEPLDANTLMMQRLLQQMDELNQYRIAAQKAPFAIPVLSNFRYTSGFGQRWGRPHNGVDFAAPNGTPIHTTADGTVSFAGWEGGYGRLIKIRHAFGIETRYAHLSKIRVKKGQRVSRGDRIGDMGNSGNSTGTHLHYEVREGGKAVNPMRYIKAAKDVF